MLSTRCDTALGRSVRNSIIEAPLFGTRRAAPYSACAGIFNFRVPGRAHTILILAALLANVLGLFSFYTYVPAHAAATVGDPWRQAVRFFADRAACLAVAQLPIVFLLAGRNSPVAILSGISFNTQMLYHRWFARIVLFQAFAHAASYTIRHAPGQLNDYSDFMAKAYVRWGATALTMLAALCFFSFTLFRKHSYEVFLVTHIVFVVLTLVGIHKHLQGAGVSPLSDFFVILFFSIACWLFDRGVRTVRLVFLNIAFIASKDGGHFTRMRATALPDGTLHIRVFLPGRATSASAIFSAQPGQHVFFACPSIQALALHPFTVMARGVDPQRVQAYIDLGVQPMNGFTRRLAARVQRSSEHILECTALVEGPYGRVPCLQDYANIVLFAGGIGITHCLAALSQALHAANSAIVDSEKGPVHGRRITLVWAHKERTTFNIAVPYLHDAATLLRDNPDAPHITVHAFATRSPMQKTTSDPISPSSSSPSSVSLDAAACKDLSKLLVGSPISEAYALNKMDCSSTTAFDTHMLSLEDVLDVKFHSGRPVLIRELECAIEQDSASLLGPAEPTRTAVVCCGAAAFADMVRDSVRKTRSAKGISIDYFEEAFAW
ncbi:hypothetical protein K437DRAFT_265690 [Tilletiaria anomala UBC 951]|uniref:FAD-binding FR-type domain-containing protein n=1 Tax=Tilletiaria anomala (strain ATCC 24038 / CBS 436.72 / UBC 951) TaxID=1037660 RepID=A0A066WRL1_TILAU|nr:uncharacterized protein K437DRAFT_265690 [Tilletiaria anomala UBC 951]KDN53639.1 hypothetical protein K437DRAFT_265690 [Tilletiaria anomala UBC 951]